jgi:phosphoribosylformylglycinamidine cyclo-ligase
MPGFYKAGEYDIAGFCVGVAERANLLPRPGIGPGDVLVGLPSSGLHSNGFSLVRKICFERMGLKVDSFIPDLGGTLGEELLKPTRLYPRAVLPLLSEFSVKGAVHVTGGGFYDNIPRILPAGTAAEIDSGAWPAPPVFGLLQRWGNVAEFEMFRTFNMGIGMILAVPEPEADGVIRSLALRGEPAFRIGSLTAGDRRVDVKPRPQAPGP